MIVDCLIVYMLGLINLSVTSKAQIYIPKQNYIFNGF
jgi:hypothetical protein